MNIFVNILCPQIPLDDTITTFGDLHVIFRFYLLDQSTLFVDLFLCKTNYLDPMFGFGWFKNTPKLKINARA